MNKKYNVTYLHEKVLHWTLNHNCVTFFRYAGVTYDLLRVGNGDVNFCDSHPMIYHNVDDLTWNIISYVHIKSISVLLYWTTIQFKILN
jgi:hypothetical protein